MLYQPPNIIYLFFPTQTYSKFKFHNFKSWVCHIINRHYKMFEIKLQSCRYHQTLVRRIAYPIPLIFLHCTIVV